MKALMLEGWTPILLMGILAAIIIYFISHKVSKRALFSISIVLSLISFGIIIYSKEVVGGWDGIGILFVKSFNRILAIFLLFGLILFTLGCTSNSNVESKNENISSLENVLKQTFTGPNPELKELLDDPENAAVIGQGVENINSENPTELDSFLQEMYQSSFTNNMYDEYIGTYALSYCSTEKQQKIDSIDIQQKETNENTYDFTANVQYHKEEKQAKTYKITGQASFSEEGKISGFKFLSDEGLSEAQSDN